MSGKLTVNLGARLEINTGMSEVENRNLAGFDTTTPNPIEPQARVNYAKAPIPEIPVADFHVLGGLLFADGPVNETKMKFLPRGAAEYALNEKMVVRGGVGLFSYDYFFENINQAGFSQPTAIITSIDNGITFTGANLTNPIPSGQLTQPVGIGAGPAEPARSEPGDDLSAGSPDAVLHALGAERAARSRSGLRRRGDLPRIARKQSAGRPIGEQHPDSVPVDVADAR